VLDKYIEAERNLGRLLGWLNVKVAGDGTELTGVHAEEGSGPVPRYCRDPKLNSEIARKYGCEPKIWKGAAWVGDGDCPWMQYEPTTDHPDEETALRYATVLAAIARIELSGAHVSSPKKRS
jgi:hypothetical protein